MAGTPSVTDAKTKKAEQERAANIKKAKQERARLLARGTTVELANGATVELVFRAPAVLLIEDEYGSIEDYSDAMKAASKGKMIRNLAFTLHAILGQPFEVAVGLIDLGKLDTYFEAIFAALAEALPEPSDEELGNAVAALGQNGSPSPGAASFTLPSPSGTSPQESSGG